MRNFISEDDIEQVILSELKEEPYKYDIIICDADPSKRDDLNDGTGRASKKECVLPVVLEQSLRKINPNIAPEHIDRIVKHFDRITPELISLRRTTSCISRSETILRLQFAGMVRKILISLSW